MISFSELISPSPMHSAVQGNASETDVLVKSLAQDGNSASFEHVLAQQDVDLEQALPPAEPEVETEISKNDSEALDLEDELETIRMSTDDELTPIEPSEFAQLDSSSLAVLPKVSTQDNSQIPAGLAATPKMAQPEWSSESLSAEKVFREKEGQALKAEVAQQPKTLQQLPIETRLVFNVGVDATGSQELTLGELSQQELQKPHVPSVFLASQHTLPPQTLVPLDGRLPIEQASQNHRKRTNAIKGPNLTFEPKTASEHVYSHIPTPEKAADQTIQPTLLSAELPLMKDELQHRQTPLEFQPNEIRHVPPQAMSIHSYSSVQNTRTLPANTSTVITDAVVTLRDTGGQIDVTLSPEELGRLNIKLEHTVNGTQITFAAERLETQELMRRHIEQIQSQLKSMGFENLSFDFNQTKGEHSSSAMRRAFDEETPEQSMLPTARVTLTGGLDIRI